ncbi:MAG: 4Fe-4S binding protein [Gammaproteobacteria bacterium]|nr:4Fe-4S binding protein [Gammaproteobacteria bacterium]
MLDGPPQKELAEDTVFPGLESVREAGKIFTRSVEGFYQRLRLFTGWPLLLGYFLSPWIMIDGRQAIFFDLPERKFHIFWLTFWPQDFGLLAWALVIAAFLLFFVTTLFGRVWCGYTCPQTVWTVIFMWVEQIASGRHQRIRLDKAPWSSESV